MISRAPSLPAPRLACIAEYNRSVQQQQQQQQPAKYLKTDRDSDFYFLQSLLRHEFPFTAAEQEQIKAIQQVPLGTENLDRDRVLRSICNAARSRVVDDKVLQASKSMIAENLKTFTNNGWKIAHQAVMNVINAGATLSEKQKACLADYKRHQTLDSFMPLYNALISDVDNEDDDDDSDDDDDDDSDDDDDVDSEGAAEFEDNSTTTTTTH